MIDTEKLKSIKLIVSDLDGTLLNGSNEIGEESKKLINALLAKGMRFTFATGRLHSAIVDHANLLGLRTPLITLDGSIIKTLNNEVVLNPIFQKNMLKKLLNLRILIW